MRTNIKFAAWSVGLLSAGLAVSPNPQSYNEEVQEAMNACGGKHLGSNCTLTAPDALSINGVCDRLADTDVLACRETFPVRATR